MARLHRTRTELRPLRTALAAALLTVLVAAPAGAQVQDPNTRASVRIEAGVTRIADEWVRQAGGAVVFRLARFVGVGGAGRIDLTHPPISGPGSPQRRFGYGGLQLDVHPAPERSPGLRVGALVGAGNLDVRDPSVETVLDSDNGAVLEPSLSWDFRFLPRFAAGASIAWRLAYGFEVLGAAESRRLSGPTLSAGLSFGPF